MKKQTEWKAAESPRKHKLAAWSIIALFAIPLSALAYSAITDNTPPEIAPPIATPSGISISISDIGNEIAAPAPTPDRRVDDIEAAQDEQADEITDMQSTIAANADALALVRSDMATMQARHDARFATAEADIETATTLAREVRSNVKTMYDTAIATVIVAIIAAAAVAFLRLQPTPPPSPAAEAFFANVPTWEPVREPVRTASSLEREPANGSRTVPRTVPQEPLREPAAKLDQSAAPTPQERALIRRWYHQLGSKSAVCRSLYGYKNGVVMRYVTDAIEESES